MTNFWRGVEFKVHIYLCASTKDIRNCQLEQLSSCPFKIKASFNVDPAALGGTYLARRTRESFVSLLYPSCWRGGEQIRSHLEVAAALGKPLILGEFGRLRPVEDRNAFLSMVYDEMASAAADGLPLAGGLLWQLAEPRFPGYYGYRPQPLQSPPLCMCFPLRVYAEELF